jgi:hypothetical protein
MSRISSSVCRPASWALVASLSAAALMLATNDTSARSGGVARAAVVAPRPISAPFIARHRRHFNGGAFNGGAFWPGVGGDYYGAYGPTDGGAYAAVTAPVYDGPRYTCTGDIPWDWAHRCPPAVVPSDKPYAPNCPTEVMKFPGRDGTEQTVNVTRCY